MVVADTNEPSNPSSDGVYFAIDKALESLEGAAPWIEDALQRAQLAQITVQESANSALSSARSRLSQIRSTSSAHFDQTIESLKDVKAQYDVYEERFFGVVKDGVLVAASYPLATGAVSLGLGLVVLKAPRRFIYRKTMGLFVGEEALLARHDARVKELRQTFESLKVEKEKLERRARLAEEEMIRGRTKLRHAGDQIRRAIISTQKIESKASGQEMLFKLSSLKAVLKELPSREASRFNSQVSKLMSEAKQERKALSKEVSKITNYGISI
ncbi:hypothetical protein V2J09_016823 [Rumex salicifolius]